MQISTPTQSIQSEALLQESNAAARSSFSGGEQNRNKVGIFAKLLEALLGKGKGEQPAAVPEDAASKDAASSEAAFLALADVPETGAAETGNGGWPFDYANAAIHLRETIELTPLPGEGIASGEDDVFALSAFSTQAGSAAANTAGIAANFAAETVTGFATPAAEVSGASVTAAESAFAEGALPEQAAEYAAQQAASRDAAEYAAEAEGALQRQTARSPDATAYAQTNTTLATDAARREAESPAYKDNPLFNIHVRDFRSAETKAHAAANAQARAETGAATTIDLNADLYRGTGFDAIEQLQQLNQLNTESEITVDLRASAPLGNSLSAKNASGEPAASSFLEDALARELRGNLSADIVKSASLIVGAGGEGTIRLALRPASLGYVKIHLEMTENKLMGRIIVESNEALRAFQKELPVLEKAFKDSGFLQTSLDMSLAQDSQSGDSGSRQNADFSPLDPALAAAIAASRYDYDSNADLSEGTDAVSGNALSASVSGRKMVNLFV